ncbi:MAG TPA: LLM class flavin-dependent oxidoreductase [Streptosporangiaceae bacterium]|nr:LLM class flavin-dependent oxidoreductase [Streptosporangiaceae bacterium]
MRTDDMATHGTELAGSPLSFGLKTSPMHTSYQAILRTWQQADEVAEIEHAWLWDHMLPLSGPKDGPCYEGWTLLAALAAQTQRLRLGLLVTNNQIRQPAVLGKIASTLDVVSGGRLVLGLGAGGTMRAGAQAAPDQHPGLAEYLAYGLPVTSPAEGLERLAETITIVRRMFTEDLFDFDGRYYILKATRNAPKPVQPGGPPVLVGGTGTRMLRLVAEHADVWNIPGPPHGSVDFITERSRVLDRHCAAIGRDPRDVARSVQLIVQGDDPLAARQTVTAVVAAGFNHVVLAVRPPAPGNIARWLADEVIMPVREELPVS